MSVTTQDIFGTAAAPEPVTPGTYGQAPSGFRLPAGTAPGPVRLQVAELGRSLDFYQRTLGLRTLEREGASAFLAAAGAAGAAPTPLVELRERRGVRPAPSRERFGLFHFAILLPDRASLGRFVLHLEEIGVHAGASDHLVSEAFYLRDPDGLGIEVYADRPRQSWRRSGRELMMATDPLDVASVVRAAGDEPWAGMPEGTTMGHVHLHVGHLATASRFYSVGLGFDRTVWSYPGALFLGAGGYHHHLGTNLWAGRAARPPGADEAQLREWTLELPDAAGIEGAMESLLQAGYSADRVEDASRPEIVTRDPWGTTLRLRVRAETGALQSRSSIQRDAGSGYTSVP